MITDPSPSAIAELLDGTLSSEQRCAGAKRLKNIIIGQDLRKELAVRNGIVQPCAEILSTVERAYGKQPTDSSFGLGEWTPDDDLRLQAVLIIDSLASGGQSFLRPLCAADIPRLLAEALSVELPTKLTTAILQTMHTLARFWAIADECPVPGYDFWAIVFDPARLKTFDALLRRPTRDRAGQTQVHTVADIIALTADDQSFPSSVRETLTDSGLIDTLASLVASYAVESKHVWSSSMAANLPPAPPRALVPSILSAISSMIADSIGAAQRFILSPSIRDLFRGRGDDRELFETRHGFNNGQTSLLPPLHIPSERSVTHSSRQNANFPALQTLQHSKAGQVESNQPVTGSSDIDHSNAVCSWLIVIARGFEDLDRLAALKLVALVANAIKVDPFALIHKSEHAQKTRERQRQLAVLAIPLAVSIVQSAAELKIAADQHELAITKDIRARACSVLALLMSDDTDLQHAAVVAGAIKHICLLLRKSFDSISPAPAMWSAKSLGDLDPEAPDTCRMGSRGLPKEILHIMQTRAGALDALGALASREDSHRQAIIEAGIVSCIIDSLRPLPADPRAEDTTEHRVITPKDGSTAPVLLAACRTALRISRSVGVLRTCLFDGGIVKPIVQLLYHPSIDIQIAATDVCCNLLTSFSPMRAEMSDGTVVKALAEHARSQSPKLRLSSLWALKNFAQGCSKELRLQILNEIGIEYIISIIQDESKESTGATAGVGLSTANAAGEQVNLLNPSSMDVDEAVTEEAMDYEAEDDDGEVLYDAASSTHYQASQMRSTLPTTPTTFNARVYLTTIREMERNPGYTTRKDEIQIQQNALDFLRNLMHDEDSGEVQDYIMNQVGTSRFYDLLTAKLLPLPRSLTGGRVVYQPTDIVLSTIHIIVHLANPSGRHRNMLMAQKPLLQAMLPHFSHADPKVRVMAVWVVNSMTWNEDEDDFQHGKERKRILQTLGYEQTIRALQDDPNQDVRARVQTALEQLGKL